MNSMHIVQILPELNQGGVERGTIELSRELILRGHQSTVISAGGSQQAQIEADGGQHITLDVCSKNPLTVPSRVAALRKTLQTLMNESAISSRKSAISTPQSALLIHARSRVPAWLSYLANKKLNLPFVTTVHGFNSVSRYSSIMTRGDRVIYGSSSIREYIVKNYSVDPSILRYVPRGIDVDAFDPAQIDEPFIRQFKQRYQLEGKTIVTMVGRITEWKGHDTFIRALADVQKQQSDVVGVIVGGIWHGKEDYFQTLEKLAADLGVTVRFTGSQSQVREIYALSHLVISAASSKAETFGRSAAEALAMNTPVIASAQGGSMDILLDRINGLLFEPGNAQDLADKILLARNHVFTNLREHIQANFSLNRMTEDELAVYRELTER